MFSYNANESILIRSVHRKKIVYLVGNIVAVQKWFEKQFFFSFQTSLAFINVRQKSENYQETFADHLLPVCEVGVL